MTYHHLSTEEKEEIFTDRRDSFKEDCISEVIFRQEMAKLGFNATEIEELVKEFRPPAPENQDGDFG